MQTTDGGSSGGVNRDEVISTVSEGIQSKLPEMFDEYNIRKSFDVPSPTQIVLL